MLLLPNIVISNSVIQIPVDKEVSVLIARSLFYDYEKMKY